MNSLNLFVLLAPVPQHKTTLLTGFQQTYNSHFSRFVNKFSAINGQNSLRHQRAQTFNPQNSAPA